MKFIESCLFSHIIDMKSCIWRTWEQ